MTIRMTLHALPLFAPFGASAFGGPLTINFTSSLLNAGRGQTITFSSSIANRSGATVFLNADSLNIPAPLTADDTKFFLNFPVSIAAGASTPTFQIFDVTVPLGAPFGLYPEGVVRGTKFRSHHRGCRYQSPAHGGILGRSFQKSGFLPGKSLQFVIEKIPPWHVDRYDLNKLLDLTYQRILLSFAQKSDLQQLQNRSG